jgi:inorganic pyrophosphatase
VALPAAAGVLARARPGSRVPTTPTVRLRRDPEGQPQQVQYDADLGHLVLDRTLWTSVVYPADYGFIVDTIGRDGDPVDAVILVASPTFPGCVIPVEPIGVFEMTDEKGEDDKVLCVPFKDPTWSHMHDITDIRDSLLDEIAHFFDVYKDLEHGADTVVGGWHDRSYADEIIAEGRAAFSAAPR